MVGGIEDCRAGSMLECGGGADAVDGSRMAALCQLYVKRKYLETFENWIRWIEFWIQSSGGILVCCAFARIDFRLLNSSSSCTVLFLARSSSNSWPCSSRTRSSKLSICLLVFSRSICWDLRSAALFFASCSAFNVSTLRLAAKIDHISSAFRSNFAVIHDDQK